MLNQPVPEKCPTGLAQLVMNQKPNPYVHSIPADALVDRAVRQMNYYRIGALVVTKKRSPIGIFTERDVLTRVVSQGRDPKATWVAEVMTEGFISIESSTSVAEAMALMTSRQCRHLPVLEDREVVGIISIGDLTKWILDRQALHIDDLVRYITGH